jgi:hypothetical protein
MVQQPFDFDFVRIDAYVVEDSILGRHFSDEGVANVLLDICDGPEK